MRRNVRTITGLVLATTALLALSACSQEYDDKRGKGDAPVQGNKGDSTAAEVFNFPDGFGNLATKCVGHGNRAYVTTNATGPSNVQIVKDSSCG
ncbi:hypothetical protein OG349_02980 [Streptomyces sp. NBC_01317]|uniref:hypothetical protein n=1 Tax=Streptomyces sp. NBC_01317 TaxID=2903822 RepID=UPI002E0D4DCA|nr:hypothetical protein OG349_02980 [Streptomyces sp. NBC_01317]